MDNFRQEYKKPTVNEKELWAKVINDCRWYDGTPDMLEQLTAHFKSQGITISKNTAIIKSKTVKKYKSLTTPNSEQPAICKHIMTRNSKEHKENKCRFCGNPYQNKT